MKHYFMRTRTRVILALCFLLAFWAFVPAATQAQWRVGASVGGDYNLYSIDPQYQVDYRYDGLWGGSAAVFGQYNFAPWRDLHACDFLRWIAVRAELEVVEKSYRFHRTGYYDEWNYTNRNLYLQLPVMAQLAFGSDKVHGFLNLGGYAGYWAYAWQKGALFDMNNGAPMPFDEPYIFQKEKDRRFDAGLVGGVGIEFLLNKNWALHLEGRCYYSLMSTVKQYMLVKDYRYNTTFGLQAGFSYIIR